MSVVARALLAVIVLVATWLAPDLARAQAPTEPNPPTSSWCTAAEAIHVLAPSERDNLTALCEGTGEEHPQTTAAALRLGGWRGVFVAHVLAERADPAQIEARRERQRNAEQRLTELLAKTDKSRGKPKFACETMHASLDGVLKDYAEAETEIAVVPPSLDELGEDSGCLPAATTVDGVATRDELLTDWRLLTYAGGHGDSLRVWIVDDTGFPVAWEAQPIAHEDGQLVLVPKGRLAAVEVQQTDLDVPWPLLQHMHEDFAIGRKRPDCLTLEVSTDPDTSEQAAPDWSLIIDGSTLELPVVAADERSKLRRRILNVARGDHDVAFVIDRPAGDDGPRIKPWISALVEDTSVRRQGCRTVSYDLRGLSQLKRYGIAQIEVDQSCRDRGILPARIRRYIEVYGQRGSTTVIPLDAWAEAMEVFRELEQRLGASPDNARGASRGELDDRKEMAALAEEVMRLGVNSLFYFDLRCGDDKTTLAGKRVELSEFANQSKAAVTGPDTDKLLLVRSHDFDLDHMREAFELVLGDLLDQPHVRFVGFDSHLDHGRRQQLRAAGYHEQADTELSLHVVALGEGRQVSSVCSDIDEINTLASYVDLADAVSGLTASDRRTVVSVSTTERGELATEIGGLPGGLYLAVAKYGDAVAASCFEVEERNIEGFISIGGFSQWRRPLPGSQGLRHDHFGYLRLITGARFTSFDFFEFGAELGYEFAEYRTDVVPDWDLVVVAGDLLDGDGRLPLNWSRHGLLLGAFVGARLPFSRCTYTQPRHGRKRGSRSSRCRPIPAEAFIDAHFYANLGFLNTSQLPAVFVSSAQGDDTTLDPNIDAALLAGVRVYPGQSLSVTVFAGVVLSDLTYAANDTSSVWTNDASLRGTFGFEFGWALANRRRP